MLLTIDGKQVEVDDAIVEATLKARNRRIVEDSDYTRKSEAANDLKKLRDISGDNRSIDDLGNYIKSALEAQNKEKTAAELLKLEVENLNRKLAQIENEKQQMAREVKKREVRDYFTQAMETEKIRLIGPILESIMASFYDRPIDPAQKAQWDADVKAALVEGQDRQNAELAKLGLGGAREDASGFSGGGITTTRNSGIPLGSPNDIEQILRQTSATPTGVPFSGVPNPIASR